MERNIEIVLYSDVIADHHNINAWTSEECFPVSKLEISERDQFAKFNIIEIVFPGYRGDKKSNDVFEEFELFFKKYVLNNSFHAYLVKVEHTCVLKNRVRSYKGIIPRQLDRNDYIEIEADVKNDCTLILGLARVIESNIDKLASLMYDSTNCFILLTASTAVFSKNFLEDLFNKYLNIDQTVCVNYLRLMQSKCIGQDTLLRVGGDGGDAEISLQVFTLASEQSASMDYINRFLPV